jgi:2-C-methyl-D-erythritol 4-phosphate cytidylyltransferase/2-C-methyl-D-erythritol 2,4-cyclodiphosphate synthase
VSDPLAAWCIVVAAGRSERFGGDLPKVLVPLRGRSVLAWSLEAADACDEIEGVVLVASPDVERGWREAGAPGRKVHAVVPGGRTRQQSVAQGLAAIGASARIVLVHDGARPFATPALMQRVARAAAEAGCAVPVVRVADTVKRVASDGSTERVIETVPRDDLRLAQTPQGFRVDALRMAHAHAARVGLEATDDVALVEDALKAGAIDPLVHVEGVPGEASNMKITRAEDIPRAAVSRIGLGHDVHPLAPGRTFVLAGIDVQPGIPEAQRVGPVGHSDGDALVHATVDALLGATAQGDIGHWFPDTSPENAGRPSMEFLEQVVAKLTGDGWRVGNVSAVVQLERPKLQPFASQIRARLAHALRVAPSCVGLSAKRGEGLGEVGGGRAIRCDVVALLERW